MDLTKILTIIEIILGLTLILFVLLQAQGTGLSVTFGGGGGFYRSKRGIEKFFFIGTIVLGILFIGNALWLFYR